MIESTIVAAIAIALLLWALSVWLDIHNR